LKRHREATLPFTYIHTHKHMHTHARTKSNAHNQIHTNPHTYTPTYTSCTKSKAHNTHTHIHRRARAHTHTYICTHTYTLKFSEHISYAVEKCTILIRSLYKSAKISWGFKHEALKTMYTIRALPPLPYGGPVWIEVMKYDYKKLKYIRVQILIN
jgi:hypothetical protein